MAKQQHTIVSNAVNPVSNEAAKPVIIANFAQALQAIRDTPVSTVPVSRFLSDSTKNYRPASDYRGEALAQDILENGQREPVIGVLVPGTDTIMEIQGNRRVQQFRLCAEKGLTFGPNAPYAGKLMGDNVDVKILPAMAEEVIAELRLDQGQRRPLEEIGLFHAYAEQKRVGKSDREIVVKLADLFNTLYPPEREITSVLADKGQDLVNNHKGTLDFLRLLYQSPTILQTAHLDVMAGVRKFPTQAEMKNLSVVYTKEKENSPIEAGITKDKPGPIFMAKWQQLQEKHERALRTPNAPKATTMLSNSQVERLTKTRESMVLRLDANIILRNTTEDTNAKLDAFMTKLEASWSPETRAEFNTLLTGAGVISAKEPTTETPATADSK